MSSPDFTNARLSVPETYPVACAVTIRVSDMDGYGHLNAIRIGQYYEEARAAFYQRHLIAVRKSRILVAEIRLRYLNEGFWPGVLQVGTAVVRIGNSSFAIAQALFQDRCCLGHCETILVHTEKGKPQPLTAEIRSSLEEFRVTMALAK